MKYILALLLTTTAASASVIDLNNRSAVLVDVVWTNPCTLIQENKQLGANEEFQLESNQHISFGYKPVLAQYGQSNYYINPQERLTIDIYGTAFGLDVYQSVDPHEPDQMKQCYFNK